MEGFLCTQPPRAGCFQLNGVCVGYSERISCIRACWGHPRRAKVLPIELDPLFGPLGVRGKRTGRAGAPRDVK